MASSQAQAEVTERRLRPLYDAIDNGQNKKALQLADKVIKKQEDLFCAKALKAIVCQRMGRQEEGNSLIDEVIKACPGDQATLQATTMYYRETGDEQKVVDLYSRAAEQYPGNQDILTHLFMAFVRVGNYHKQQQTAVQLHKAFPDNGPYYCWRVMSIVMQAHKTNDGSLASTMFLPLAEKLMEKYVVDKKLDIEEEVKLYLMVLDRQGKAEKRLEVIKGPLGDLIRRKEDHDRLELDCYLSLQRWDDAVVLLTRMLHRSPDQWAHIEVYVSCQINRYKKSVHEAKEEYDRERRGGRGEEGGGGRGEEGGGGRGEEGGGGGVEEEVWEGRGEKEEGEWEEGCGGKCEDNMNTNDDVKGGRDRLIPRTPSPQPLLDARDLLEAFRTLQSRDPAPGPVIVHPIRGPFLGRLELVRQVIQSGLQNIVDLPSPSTLLMDYFAVFGTKGCCFDDLRGYFDFFSTDELKRFMVLAEAKVTEQPINFDCPPEDIKQNISCLWRQITLMQLQRYCGYHRSLSHDEKADLVLLCKHMYKEGLKLTKDVLSTDSKPADFFAVLAVHLLMEIYLDTMESSVLWEAILLLEHARSMKTTNPQIFLLLMRLYGFIGAAEGVTDMFEALNIKHLQMETLGYIPLRYLQSSGAFEFANHLYRSALRFYYSCAKETSEYIIQAYKKGMFQKILEFVGLRDKVSHSLSFACTLVDMNLMEVVTSIHSMEKAQQFFGRDWFNGLPSTGTAINDYCSGLVDSRDLSVYDDWSRVTSSVGEMSSLTNLENKLSSDVEVLWLRVRVMLVQCLKDAVLHLATASQSTTQEVGGERGAAPEAVAIFNDKVTEFDKCLKQMAGHMGMLVLKQKKAHLLPLQTSPPCLGLQFLSSSYGTLMMAMFAVVEKLALGESDNVGPRLKEILTLMRGSVSEIRGIPDDLRQVVTEVVRGKPRQAESSEEKEGKGGEGEREEEEVGERGGDVVKGEGEVDEKVEEVEGGEEDRGGEEVEGKGVNCGKVKDSEVEMKNTRAILLNSVPNLRVGMEQYSLFISVVGYVVLLVAVCVDIIKPTTSQSARRKKKKKKQSSDDGGKEHSSWKELVTFIEDLCTLIHDTSRSFQPIPSVDRQLINLEEEIRQCQLPFTHKHFEQSMFPVACKQVLQSYNVSMEDSKDVLDNKLAFLDTLLQTLGSERSSVAPRVK